MSCHVLHMTAQKGVLALYTPSRSTHSHPPPLPPLANPPTMASSQCFIKKFFSRFPEFQYNRSEDTMAQFKRLALEKDWPRKEYKKEKKALKTALVLQFNHIYGESEKEMKGWRALCRAMGADPIPKTPIECMRLFQRTNVNLVDLVDTWRTGNNVPTYPTVNELSSYTRNTEKYFPRKHAKAGGLLKFLLRKILKS
ncbi:hypothetical protein BDY19DRAFT_108672 [Irpex rosettiformis]|uniref:Uncharacterized protein n=1 Tax=Irpex rosettiformis TaxID=378272 RepID=A0ACB8U5M6_9APHY|nr:hypothetical protein BDY19DRAFT_108672 [Irpex rosettiformis]